MTHDVIIKNGMLIDGTGAPGRRADLAIDGDRVTAIGRIEGDARLTIDAAGKLVTPGFVDIHTHLDAQLAWDPIASSSCYHGVTSVVLGNCGVTFAPVRRGQPIRMTGDCISNLSRTEPSRRLQGRSLQSAHTGWNAVDCRCLAG